MLLSTISYICLNTVDHPTPESMLFVVKERLEGLKHNIGLGGRGLECIGEGDRYVNCLKVGHFIEVSQHVCPSL